MSNFKKTDKNKYTDKRDIILYANKLLLKDNKKISKKHIEAILNILIDEIIEKLLIDKKLKFNNFGTFKLGLRGARKVRSIMSGQTIIAKSTNRLQFYLHDKLKKLLIEHLDIDSTL